MNRAAVFLYSLGFVFSLSAAALAQDRTFGGNDCTDDCSGHKAGYEWADDNQIKDERLCTGYSNSFIQGCRTFVEDPYRGADTDDDGNDIE
jgi:hypothetical protein